MGSWYKLGKYDSKQLALMIRYLCDDRNRATRAYIALFCWSQMQAKGEPCPYFRIGIRKIAKECETTPRTVQRFIERAEREGWIVNLGEETNRAGKFTKRTFWWVAEEAAENAGMDVPEWLAKEGGVTVGGYTPGYKSRKNGYTGVTTPVAEPQVDGGVTAHQSTEYSERASRTSAGAEALAQSDLETLDWYAENGIEPIVPEVAR